METKHFNAADQELANSMLLNFLEVRRETPHHPDSWKNESILENWLKGTRHAAVTAHAELELWLGFNERLPGHRNYAVVKARLESARVEVFNAIQCITRALVTMEFTREGKPLDRPPVSGRNAMVRMGIALAIEDQDAGRVSGEQIELTPRGLEAARAAERGTIGDVNTAAFQNYESMTPAQLAAFNTKYEVSKREKKATEIAPVRVGTHAQAEQERIYAPTTQISADGQDVEVHSSGYAPGEKRSADAVEKRVPVADPGQPGAGTEGLSSEGVPVFPVSGAANVCNAGTASQDSDAGGATQRTNAQGTGETTPERALCGVLPDAAGSSQARASEATAVAAG